MFRRLIDFGLLAALALLWTWPLALHLRDSIPGLPGDNFSFLWNLWWMRRVLSDGTLSFFHSSYLFSPFGVDLINHPNTALQGLISATVLSKLSIVQAENFYIVVSVFLNAAAAYALVYDITRQRRLALLAAVAFGDSPYIAAHLMGHFDLLTAWVIPLFALCLRRSLSSGSWKAAVAGGLCVAIAAYSAYYHVVYIVLFAVTYTIAWLNVCRVHAERRTDSRFLFSLRLLVVAAMVLDLFVMLWILFTGGTTVRLGRLDVSIRGFENPVLIMWCLAAAWALARWRLRIKFDRPSDQVFWRVTQALSVMAAVFLVVSMPLVIQAFRLVASGRYVTQQYFYRSAPAGIDVTAFISGNSFHPLLGGVARLLDRLFSIDRIEQAAWLGVVPVAVLAWRRGAWLAPEEARRWKIVMTVFAIWALGPFLIVAGVRLGLPLPQMVARFIPLVDNARMPGRAMVGVYLALGVLMALRLSAQTRASRPALEWGLVALLAFDYFNAPIALTHLDQPLVYQRLATVQDNAPVIEVPFGIGDGLSMGLGAQDRRILYYATIHGHPLVGGFIGRMPPGVMQAYIAMPVVGTLLRLSGGQTTVDEEEPPSSVPFRYLVLDTVAASPELIAYVHAKLDVDLLERGEGRELYAVQGVRPPNVMASR